MDQILEDTILYSDIDIPIVALKKTTFKVGLLEIKLKPGTKAQVPFRILKKLYDRGDVKPDMDELMSLTILNKIQWMEKKSSEFMKIDEGFYLKAKLFFKILRERIKEGDEKSEIVFRKAKILISDIVRRRVSKIVRLAVANPQPSRELMEKMTIEEKIFYTKICSEIDKWTNGLVDFILGE